MSEIKTDVNQAQTHDAQRLAEEVAAGDRPALNVDVDADYEASKEFSVSELDKTGEGQAAAEAATAPQFEIPEPEETELTTEPTGNPDAFLDMASDITPQESTGNVDDDLVKKAIELGQPGE